MDFITNYTSVQQEILTETWKISNFLHCFPTRILPNNYYSTQLLNPRHAIAPHVFIIGETASRADEVPFQAQASLSLITSSPLVLTVSLPNRNQNPCYKTVANFVSIQLVFNFRGTTSMISLWEPNSPNTTCSGEVDLRNSNCSATLFIKLNETQEYLDTIDQSLTIRFSLLCKITKQSQSLQPPTNAELNLSLQLCGFQALNDFESLLKDKTAADIEIKVTSGKPTTFQCHKLILTARSPILHAMFDSPMKESRNKVLVVEDISAEAMEHFISFLYCGRFQDESWIKSLPHLAYAADKYCVSSLKDLCDTNLIRSVTCQNALAIANLAHRHQLTKAVDDIRNFIAKNASKLNFDIAAAAEGLDLVD